jgi:hypothetical protein
VLLFAASCCFLFGGRAQLLNVDVRALPGTVWPTGCCCLLPPPSLPPPLLLRPLPTPSRSPLLSEGDFEAKPSVLLLGQYSTGKSTIMKYLLGRDYPGIHIGPEPTTDRCAGFEWGGAGRGGVGWGEGNGLVVPAPGIKPSGWLRQPRCCVPIFAAAAAAGLWW